MEQHIASCADCTAELDSLRLTTAALRILPDREIPQRIAFVSDKVFEPSATARWFSGFWNSASKLGFASACVLAAGLIVSGVLRNNVSGQLAPAHSDIAAQVRDQLHQQVDDAVTKAVAQVRTEDARITQAALPESERKQAAERQALMVAMGENLELLQKRFNTANMLASLDASRDASRDRDAGVQRRRGGCQPMKAFLLILTAAGILSRSQGIEALQQSRRCRAGDGEDKFRATRPGRLRIAGTARCPYLEGYGALTSVEIQLVFVSGITPFRPAYSAQEIAALHDRKLKKIPVLKDAMRGILASSALALDSVPPNEHIALEAKLWHYSWEDSEVFRRAFDVC